MVRANKNNSFFRYNGAVFMWILICTAIIFLLKRSVCFHKQLEVHCQWSKKLCSFIQPNRTARHENYFSFLPSSAFDDVLDAIPSTYRCAHNIKLLSMSFEMIFFWNVYNFFYCEKKWKKFLMCAENSLSLHKFQYRLFKFKIFFVYIYHSRKFWTRQKEEIY